MASDTIPCGPPLSLLEALKRLGESEDAVAKTLLEGCHLGAREDACRCPIARYLESCGFEEPCVDQTSIAALTPNGLDAIDDEESFPLAVRDFIGNFDDGHHPDLIADYDDRIRCRAALAEAQGLVSILDEHGILRTTAKGPPS